MPMVTMVPDHGGWFQCFLENYGFIPTQLYLWMLTAEFHVIFMSCDIFLNFLQLFKIDF